MKKRAVFIKKFVTLFIAIIIFVMVLFNVVFSIYVNRTGKTLGKARQNELLTLLKSEIDAEFAKLNDISAVVMSDSRLITKFSELSEDNSIENHFDKNLLDSIEYSTIIASTNSSRPPLWRICIYNHNGDFLYSGAVCQKDVVAENLEKLNVMSLMYKFSNNSQNYDMFIYEKDAWSNLFNSRYIVLRRPLMNIHSNTVFGLIELSLDVSVLQNIIDRSAGEETYISIVDSDGEIIASSGDRAEKGKKMSVEDGISSYPWQIYVEQPEKSVMQPYRFMIFIVAVGSLFLTVCTCYAIFAVSVRLSRPLLELERAVSGITFENTDVVMPKPGKTKTDEIKELYAAFNAMLNRMNNLMMLEKKASMLALQSQINPHFLFNTLAVIGAAGSEAGCVRVEKLCNILCSMLRYSANFENTTVCINDEVDYIKDYLKLMKARYEDFLSYEIHVGEDVGDMKIPKMVLQPLVENSFTHGFVNMEPPYFVRVDIYTVKKENGKALRIELCDNGSGFSENELNFFVDRVKRLEEGLSENLSSTSIGGLGLASAVLRMKLLSGKDVDLKIENNLPHGAKIIIEEVI